MARDDIYTARDEICNTEDEKFMKVVKTVRDLIIEDNASLTFFSELEKFIDTIEKNYCKPRKQNSAEIFKKR